MTSLKKWFDGMIAGYIKGILVAPDVVVSAKDASPKEEEGHFVIVNVSEKIYGTEGHPVLPEHPETYPTLGEAMIQAIRLNKEFGLTTLEAKIYQLREVPPSEMYEVYGKQNPE